MKKPISFLLALIIMMSAFMGLGFTATALDTQGEYLAVTLNDVTTNVKVGDTFRYTMTLTDVEIINCQAEITYDSDYLTVSTVDEADEDAYDAYIAECFPVVYDSAILNTDVEDLIFYNCSRVKSYKFTGENTLITLEFTANKAGETVISTEMIEMAKALNDFYVDKTDSGSVLVKEYTSNEFITYVPTEDPSSEEPSSDEPSSEDPSSEDPSSEEPSSEEPSSEEPSSEEPQKPVKVENIVATPDSASATLSWDAVEGATKYWIYKNKAGSYVAYSSTTATSAVVGDLDGDTTYQFKVVAVLADGSMQKLADADVVEFTTLAPVVVEGLGAATDITSATLSWNAVEGAQKYWVYKAFEENGPFYVYDCTTNLEYTVRHLQPDTTYYFKVVPAMLVNGKLTLGEVEAADKITVTTTSGETITVKVTDLTSTTATISWQPYENAQKYWVMLSRKTKSSSNIADWIPWAETTDTTYTFNLAGMEDYYYFTVVALYTDSQTGTLETVNYLADGARLPYSDGDIINFTAVDDDTVTLTWSAPENITKVWISYIDENGKEVVVDSATENTITLDIENYKNYKFAINALDTSGFVGYITRLGGEAYHE